MAAIDKTYINNKKDYEDLIKWVETQKTYTIPTTGESFHIKDYMYNWSEAYVLSALEVGNEVPIWNTPQAVDKYLYNNCPLKFVQDRLKDQYSDPEKTLKYFKNPESGKCKIMKFIKISKYIDIELEVLDKEGNPLMYSDSIKKWVDPDDALSMGYFVTKRLSPRKLRRLLKKWRIPKGYAVYARLYGIKYMHLPIKLTSFAK